MRGEFQEFILVSGAVIPINTYYLDAVEGGRVDTVYLEAGTFVEKGERILKLANTNLLNDSHLYAVDIETGQEKWKFKAKGKVFSSPVIPNGMVFFGSQDDHLYVLK